MKKFITATLLMTTVISAGAQNAERNIIRIATDNTDLVLEVGPNNRLYQTYLGPKLMHDSDIRNLSWNQISGSDGSVSTRGWEAYSTSGNEDFF